MKAPSQILSTNSFNYSNMTQSPTLSVDIYLDKIGFIFKNQPKISH